MTKGTRKWSTLGNKRRKMTIKLQIKRSRGEYMYMYHAMV
jgi:hypothetical protein